MTKFIALRSKWYIYKHNSKEEKKCKGIKEHVIKKTLKFDDHINCLCSGTNHYRSQLMFRSTKHEVHTVKVNKVAHNRDDDKRIIKKNKISSFAKAHKYLCWSLILGEVSLI